MATGKEAVLYTAKLAGICVLLCLVCFAEAVCFFGCTKKDLQKSASADPRPVRIILDAGHGGRDGGAVGTNGVTEKEINLALTSAMCDILHACGEIPLCTRTGDALVCDESDPALRGRIKMTDLKNRAAMAKENPDAIFVSIHMNTFPQGKYSGLQGYYSGNNEKSLTLAQSIQERTRAVLQPENTRKIKPGGHIYLLERIENPAVLIECGFLSNEAECARLCASEYRTRLALVLCDCIGAVLPELEREF